MTMYPVTHLHLLSQLTELDGPGALGAMFPDTCITGELKWEATHCPGFQIASAFSEEQDRRSRSFLLGLFTHTADPRGLDYYNDQKLEPYRRGYSFVKAAPLVEGVKTACRVDESISLWKAHNFIEMGIENLIARENPPLNQALFSAFADRETIEALSLRLADFFHTTPEVIVRGYRVLEQYSCRAPEDPLQLAETYRRQLELKHQLDGVDVEAVKKLILQSQEIVRGDYRQFLEFCREKIASELTAWL